MAPQGVVAGIFGTTSALVVIFVPIYYYLVFYEPSIRFNSETPYENDVIKVAIENNRMMLYMHRRSGMWKINIFVRYTGKCIGR